MSNIAAGSISSSSLIALHMIVEGPWIRRDRFRQRVCEKPSRVKGGRAEDATRDPERSRFFHER